MPDRIRPELADLLGVELVELDARADGWAPGAASNRDVPASNPRTAQEPAERSAPGEVLSQWCACVERRLERLEAQLTERQPATVHQMPPAPAEEPRVRLRLYGDVAAGVSWRPDDQHQECLIPASIEPRCAHYPCGLVQVSGDSMMPTYRDGELLVIERAELGLYRQGDVVVVLLDGAETALYRYGGQGSRARPPLPSGIMRLTKDNPTYPAIERPHDPKTCVVQAIVRASVPEEEVERCED